MNQTGKRIKYTTHTSFEKSQTNFNFYLNTINRIGKSENDCVHLGSISPAFYEQLLCVQIPKAQKDSQLKQLFALLGSAGIKAAHKHVDDINTRCNGCSRLYLSIV